MTFVNFSLASLTLSNMTAYSLDSPKLISFKICVAE